ncbi:uncharacterized protein LOC121559676 [Coregonus clupeaformis]|uniref:uncharacterized protein LOC121559676 n=1 Tax=Coregonus clupeaformis TaxID=59861 RepID=UPI001E1C6B7E|nr:uncharacterized protein LOC121559676 [Coregonus clupeaformis]
MLDKKNETATGHVDVTYAEVNLKQQAKAKKKKETETPPEADSVYSQVKPVTAPGVGVPLFINKTVGDSVELLPISKVVIQTDIKLLANHSCTVRLVCNMSCYSNLTYTWERDNEIAGLPSLLDRSYSVEPLSGNVTTEDSYTLIPAGPNHKGGYVCRAGRGDPVYDTLYSEHQFLWSGDLHPSVSLRIRPNRTQHFTSKSLSLSCEEKGNSTGWRLKRYRERGVESGCGSNWGSISGSTCTIRSTLEKDSGVYWCESASGEYSNAVNITVDAGAVILENTAYPMTEEDSVTLLCTNRYPETNPNPKVDFYKDGELIRNETTGGMTIPAVSKSDEGFYNCESNEGESPESWVTVRGEKSSMCVCVCVLLCGLLVVSPFLLVSIMLMVKCCRAQVLVVVVVGLVVAGVLLAILLVLLCRYKNAKGPPSHTAPTWTPNRTKDLPRARLLMLGTHV